MDFNSNYQRDEHARWISGHDSERGCVHEPGVDPIYEEHHKRIQDSNPDSSDDSHHGCGDDSSHDSSRQYSRQQTNRDSERPPYTPYTTDSAYADKPKTHLVWAVLCTLLCCIPFGIVSIVYASKVESLWNIGAFKEAHDAARKARLWALWGFVIGIGYILLTFISAAIYFISLPVDYGYVW